MSPEERERLNALCDRIAKEDDQHRFLRLIKELNDLLDRKKRPHSYDSEAILNPAKMPTEHS